MTVDPQKIIGDTVFQPETVKPLPVADCSLTIPKPDFFIVGGAKCGSTMLAYELSQHPDCCHSVPKETNFFTLNYEQGWDWYRGTFAHYNGEAVVGEGSVSYGIIPFRKNVVSQIYDYNPRAKIIYIVRHPLRKLISGWKMALAGPGYVGHSSAKQGFEQYVLHEVPRHPEGGDWTNPTHGWRDAAPSGETTTRVWLDAIHYQGQIDNYRRLFPDQQIRTFFLEDWKQDRDREAAKLCEFLGLDPDRLPPPPDQAINRADERRQRLPFFHFVANSKITEPLRHLFPKAIRRPLRSALFHSRLGSRKVSYPDLEVSDQFRTALIAYLRAKTAAFLVEHGKPLDFWTFDEI